MTTQAPPRLPRYQGNDVQLRVAWDQLCAALEGWMSAETVPGPRYLVTNAADVRTLNSGTATTSQAASVLATLLTDLRNKGVLG